MYSALVPPTLAFLTSIAGLPQAPTLEFLSVNGAADADGPTAAEWSQDGEVLLVVQQLTDEVTFLDPELRTRVAVGAGPLDIKMCPVSGRAFVPNSKDNTLSVIDVGLAEVIETIPLTGSFPCQVEIASTGAFAVVSCVDSDSVSIVDLTTLAEIATMATVEQSGIPGEQYYREDYRRMDLGPDDRTLAVPGSDAVGVYDVVTGTMLREFVVDTYYGEVPVLAGVGPSGRYVATIYRDGFRSFPHVLDVTTGEVRSLCGIFYYGCPDGDLVVSPDAEVALIASAEGEMVFLSLETQHSIATLPAAGPSMDLSADGRYAFVGGYTKSRNGFEISVVDMQSMTTLTRRTTREDPGAKLVVHPSNQRVAGFDWYSKERSTWFDWDGERLQQTAQVSTGAPPEGDGPERLACDARGGRLVSVNRVSDTMTIVDLESGERHIVEVAGTPKNVDIDDAGRVAAVAYIGDLPISIVDLENRRIVADVDCGYVGKLAVSGHGKRIYATDSYGDASKLHVIDITDPSAPLDTRVELPYVGDFSDRILPVSREDIVAVAQKNQDRLTFVDGVNGKVVGDLGIFNQLGHVAFSPDGRFAYATNNDLLRKAGVSREGVGWIGNVELEEGAPRVLRISADGRFAFLGGTSYVAVIDTERMSIVSSVDMPFSVTVIKQVGPELLVGSGIDAQLHRLRIDSKGQITPVDTLSLSGPLRHLVVAPDQKLYVACRFTDTLDVYDFATTDRFGPMSLNPAR